MLEVRLLGQFDVRRDSSPIVIASRPAQSLLAYLLLNVGVEHRREKLAGILWPDATEKNARSNLRHALWQLRDAIELKRTHNRSAPYLLVDDISIAFNAASKYWIDAAIVQAASATIASADELINALDRYRGELLPGFYDDWAVLERERLRAVFEQRMAQLLERLMEEQRWTAVIENAERWIALGQTPEPGFRALMIAYSQIGDRAKMAASWQRLVDSLATDLGVEPAEQTRQLYEQLKTGSPVALAAKTPKTSPAPTKTLLTNLPISLTSFVGRESEIAEVTRLLATTRMLSLIGPGGIGKTRLAMEVGARLLDRFVDGVWLIELAPLTDPKLFRQTVAAGLGLREREARSIEDMLVAHLRQKHLLLILDNCEHMIDACAQSAAAWLKASEHLKIIVTSRQALNIGGEMTWLVPALSLPESTPSLEDSTRSEAVQLFIERSQFALPGLRVTDLMLESVAAICRRLDGLALAIELAASRVDMLSLEEIQRGMDHSLQLLTEGNRVASARHQTLRACLDWSWRLLSADEQLLFRRLAVFSGVWTLEDAEQVCADDALARTRVLQVLGRLVRKSMVTVQARESESRYRVLETIRIYAFERLNESGEAERLSTRHRDWYLQLAEELYAQARELKAAAQKMTRLSLELDNLRAALDWCRKEVGGAEIGLRLSGALGPFWEKQNVLKEGREWIMSFLELTKNCIDMAARARAFYSAGYLAHLQGDDEQAILLYEECLKIGSTDLLLMARTHLDLGQAHYLRLNYEAASQHLNQAIERGESIQDPVLVALARMRLGNVYHDTGDLGRAVASHNSSLQAFEKAGYPNYIAAALGNLARVHHQRTEYEDAVADALQAIKLYESLDNRLSLSVLYNNLSIVYMDLSNYAEAVEYLKKSLEIAEAMENESRQAIALGDLAECQLHLGEITAAKETIARAVTLAKRAHTPLHEGNQYRVRAQIEAAHGEKEAAQKDFELAQSILEPLKDGVRLARLHTSFGTFLMADPTTAFEGMAHLERALEIRQALGSTKEVEKIKALLREANPVPS